MDLSNLNTIPKVKRAIIDNCAKSVILCKFTDPSDKEANKKLSDLHDEFALLIAHKKLLVSQVGSTTT